MDPIFAHFVEEEEDRQRKADLQLERRMLRDRIDPLNLPDKEFKRLFRLNKELFQNLIIELAPFLEEGQRSTKLSIENRVIAALRFFASGSYQKGIGDEHNVAISQQAMNNTITEICTAIETIAPRWIKFPLDEDRKQEIKLQFMERFGFPGTIGALDCTHVAIAQPTEDEHLYFNRKRYHSKNVQIVCDSNLEILNVNANFGGAAHDSFIWRQSALFQNLQENYVQANRSWLIGDSGYPQQPWLMTPLRNTVEGTPERRYDTALTLARNCVERCIVSAEIIKKLQDRVKKLLVRNEELVNLLKHAGIRVPSVYGSVKKFGKSNRKYTNVFSPNQAEILQKDLEKENQAKLLKQTRPKKTKRESKKKSSNFKATRVLKSQISNVYSSPKCFYIVSHPRLVNNSCYIFSKGPRKINQTAISHSLLSKTPIVSSNVKPSVYSTNPHLSDMRAGTIVFANGTVMPVIPSPSLPVLPAIITNPVQTNLPAYIVVSSSNNISCTTKIPTSIVTKPIAKPTSRNFDLVSSVFTESSKKVSSRTLSVLRPKTCITRTTQINKVPIPALSSKYNGHLSLDSFKQYMAGDITKQSTNEQSPKKIIGSNKSIKKRSQEQFPKQVKKRKLESQEKATRSMESAPNKASVLKSDEATSQPETTSNAMKELLDQKQADDCLLSAEPPKMVSDSNLEPDATNPDFDKTTVVPKKPLEIPNSIPNEMKKSSETLSRQISDMNSCGEIPIKSNETTELSMESNEIITTSKDSKLPNNELIAADLHANSEEQTKSKTCASTSAKCEEIISSDSLIPDTNSNKISCNKEPLKSLNTNKTQSDNTTKHAHTNDLKPLDLNLAQSDLSNDIFASFQVPTGCQNPGSTSPTAAFLLAFPLVSSGIKVTEVIGEENSESHAGTPNLLQIGTMDISKPTQSYSESLTPSLLNLESFSFFSSKDNCGGYYNNCSISTCQTSTMCNSKASSSFNSATITAVHHGVGNHSNLSKSDATVNSKHSISNKLDNIGTNTMNQCNYKQGNLEKVTRDAKNSNIDISFPDQSRLSKDAKIHPYINSNYGFNRGNELGNINSSMLDINTNPFPSKLSSNENYATKNKCNSQMFVPKSSESCVNYPSYKDCTQFASSSTVANKNYNPVYTSATSNAYFYNPGLSGDTKNFNPSNYGNYTDFRKSDNYQNYGGTSQDYNHKEKINQSMQPKTKQSSTQNKPINWMTSPSTTLPYKPEYFLPSFSKEHNFNSSLNSNTTFNTLPTNTYLNTSSVYNHTDPVNNSPDLRKTADLTLPTYSSYQRTDIEDNQFPWSPNKMPQFLDPAHSHTFVSSTLPTLVGDLALNNTPVSEPKNIKDKTRENRRKTANCESQSGQTNFLSVSQLVEHNQEHCPAKVISRRSSGNRNKTNTPKSKRTVNRSEINKDVPNYQKTDKINHQKHYDNSSVTSNMFSESKQRPNNNKNIPSSYSAEALIGNQFNPDSSAKRNVSNYNKSIVPNFLGDNIVSYFPSVDVPQDNNYVQTNQNFQANTFSQNFTTSFQNNSYGSNNFIPSACSITPSFIPNNNFVYSTSNQEFSGEHSNVFHNGNIMQTKDRNNYMKSYYRQPDKDEKNQAYNCKKAKKKGANESSLPSFDIPFLSMPGGINSPILPEDFHTTYLPPTTLYSCKNPLYSKPNVEISSSTLIPPLPTMPGSKSSIQNSEMSQSANSVGTSLTNFNLSTIFPEINQVPFSSKTSAPFGTFGT